MTRVTLVRIVAISMAVFVAGCASAPRTVRDQPLTVVITGASSGFGRGVAHELAARGENVVLAARRTELLGKVAREAARIARGLTHGAVARVIDRAQMEKAPPAPPSAGTLYRIAAEDGARERGEARR